jgi:putative heme-binding domain-containing protein
LGRPGLNPYSFRWNNEQTDAALVSGEGTNELFTVSDPQAAGGQRPTPWRFMSRAECLRCHNAWAGEAITLNWLQLGARHSPAAPDEEARSSAAQNQSAPASGATELERLQEGGVLRIKRPPRPLPQPLADPYDSAFPLADRARTWLHVNCATCHRFGAGGGVAAQFNYEQPIEQSRAFDTKPARGDFGIPAARVIAPGDPYRSTLLYRVSTEGSGRMPHIGSRLVDPTGVRLLRDWIRSLPAKPDPDPDLNAARKLAEENEKLLARCQTTKKNKTQNQAESRSLRFLPPEQRRKTLGLDFDPQIVLSRAGDGQHGRELFFGVAQCSRCHVCGGEGRAFGPDLTAIAGKYNREQLLEQVLSPSKVIAPEFKTTTVSLRDETEASGFVVKRTGTELVLRDETLAERHVKLSDVKESRESVLRHA